MKITSSLKWKPLLISIAIPLLVGGISSLISMNGYKHYGEVEQPMLSPPSWVFPVVWTILFILMGISSYLVYERDRSESRRPLSVYAIQLVLNFMWPIFYFTLGAYLFSFIWLIILWLLVIIMTFMFYNVSKVAGLLQIPYVLWLTFAAYLNLGVFILN